jgi:hypothetical protein
MAIGVEKLKDSSFSGLVGTRASGDGTGAPLTAPAYGELSSETARRLRHHRRLERQTETLPACTAGMPLLGDLLEPALVDGEAQPVAPH